ncbi:MAG TPA: hypothetical protein VGD17_03090 [Chitinophagaceae bacterium]
MGIFEASIPCNKGSKPFPGIPTDAKCEFIKCVLTLYLLPGTQSPDKYILQYSYGMSEPNTTGLKGGGITAELQGNWKIAAGRVSDKKAVIYQLFSDKSDMPVSFVKLNDQLLHLLDSDNRLMIGSAAWSFTFNRTK